MRSENSEPVQFEELRAGRAELSSVAAMLKEMYLEFQSLGSFVRLAKDGEQVWVRGISPLLGKTGGLFLAISRDQPIGFAHGVVRVGPAYLEPSKSGFISHVFVYPKFRGRKVGHQLVDRLENWFLERDVQLIELNVVRGNTSAKAFWESRGFELDMWQLRKSVVLEH